MKSIWQFLSWWCWRRWRIYCPSYPVAHLFERPGFQKSLFDYDEDFVSPCCLHPENSGAIRDSRWRPKIRLIGLEPDERMKDE